MHITRSVGVLLAAVLVAAGAAVIGAPAAGAGGNAPINVTTTADGVAGGLRAALNTANAQDGDNTIVLAAGGTYNLTACGGGTDENSNVGGDLDSLPNAGVEFDGLTVDGSGGATIRQTCPGERVFDGQAYGNLEFRDVTITGGDTAGFGGGVAHNNGFAVTLERVRLHSNSAGASGGGLFQGGGGSIFVDSSVVRDNTAGVDGGGISYNGTITAERSTVSGNEATGTGGGLHTPTGTVILDGSTVSGNSAAQGAAVSGFGVTSTASTVVDNTASAGAAVRATSGGLAISTTVVDNPPVNCAIVGGTVSTGYSYEAAPSNCGLGAGTGDVTGGPDPLLGPRAANGGLGATHLPGLGSPLVDAIPNVSCTLTNGQDAANTVRPEDGDFDDPDDSCDIGAVERPQLVIFSDVPKTHQFFRDIGWMAWEGISTGFPGGEYRPGQAVSRQAMSAFMYRLAGSPPHKVGEPSFSDVPFSSQFFTEIEWMNAEGITTGFPGGVFRPSQAVSRQAMSAFLYRFAEEPFFTDPSEPTFEDVPVDSQFFHEIEWMAAEEVTTGFPGNLFKPSQAVSRQAMSAFMHRFSDLTF
jgi:hypothetical protein